MKRISVRKLFRQSFEDHEGRPGKIGGSLPKKGGSRAHLVDQSGPRGEKPISGFKSRSKLRVTNLKDANKSTSGQVAFLKAEMKAQDRRVALVFLRDQTQRHLYQPKAALEVIEQSPNLLWKIEYAGPGE